MNKSSKGKKTKVPKLTEAEYAAYISSLKSGEEAPTISPTASLNLKSSNAERLEN